MFHVVSHLNACFRGLITSVGEERAKFSAIVYLQSYDFYSEGFLFLLVLEIGCFISLWHPLGLPYNNFDLECTKIQNAN